MANQQFDYKADGTALERAFELARSGSCLTIRDTAYQLNKERYDLSPLEGPALKQSTAGNHQKDPKTIKRLNSFENGFQVL